MNDEPKPTTTVLGVIPATIQGGVYGLDAAGNLVLYEFPGSERYFKAGPPDTQKWTNT